MKVNKSMKLEMGTVHDLEDIKRRKNLKSIDDTLKYLIQHYLDYKVLENSTLIQKSISEMIVSTVSDDFLDLKEKIKLIQLQNALLVNLILATDQVTDKEYQIAKDNVKESMREIFNIKRSIVTEVDNE